ncbi:MAG: hypothetical protein OXF46_07665 [Rhodobacteraceae bacterium]|nr:hypothetical protein [Paracoccaceae bacterium]
MKWQGKGCYGYVVQKEDRQLGLIARKVYSDENRWPELSKLNNLEDSYRLGQCLKVFDVHW